MEDTRLRDAIRRIAAANDALRALNYRRLSNQVLGPPAAREEIARLEHLAGFALPASYVHFLELHDGWRHFSGEADVLGIADRMDPAIRDRVDHFRRLLTRMAGHDSERAFPVVAGAASTYVVYLDPGTQRSDGEMDVVEFGYEEGEIDRYESFTAYLEDQAGILEELVEEERGVRR